MGKPGRKKRKSRGNKFSQGKVSEGLGSAFNEGFQSLVDTSSRDYVYDEVDQYHDNINQSGLNEATRSMKVHKAKKENVLSLNMDSSDEDEEAAQEEDVESDESEEDEEEEESDEERFRPFVADDDIVKSREEQMPDERAWGKDRSLYYGSNVTDQTIRKRATHLHLAAVHDVATLELEANKERQRRMQAALEGFDPSDILNLGEDSEEPTKANKKQKKGADVQLTILPKDVSKLPKDKKLKLLKQLSPEFILLTKDMLHKVEESELFLEPIMKALSEGHLASCPATDYVHTKYKLCKNYSLAVMSYVFLVCSKGHAAVKQHRVIKKLSTYRFLFQELEPLDSIMRPQLETLVDRLNNHLPLGLLCPADDDSTAHDTTPQPDSSPRNARKPIKAKNNQDVTEDSDALQSEDSDGDEEEAASSLHQASEVGDGAANSRGKVAKRTGLPVIDMRHGTVMLRGKEVKWSRLDPSMRKMLLKREQAKLVAKSQPPVTTPKPVKMLSLLTSQKRAAPDEQTEAPPAKKAKGNDQGGEVDDSDSDSDDEAVAASAARSRGRGEVELSADARRPIDKTITKNRGLTPHRKKELKNPRIKYRTKYSEKVKRRRGQVRPVHKEIPYYTGEKSGINMYAIKSVKFK